MVLSCQDRIAVEERCSLYGLDIADLGSPSPYYLLAAWQGRFRQLAKVGEFEAAGEMWQLIDGMDRAWPQSEDTAAFTELAFVEYCYWKGDLKEEDLARAEQLTKAGRLRYNARYLQHLRGNWLLDSGQRALAADSFRVAVKMAREVGQPSQDSEVGLAVANFHLGRLPAARDEAERLSDMEYGDHLRLAELWDAIGDQEQAKKHALAAYKWAWSDGEPYVYRHGLMRASELLGKLGVAIPELPRYDPANDERLPWEDELVAAIAKLRAENKKDDRGDE